MAGAGSVAQHPFDLAVDPYSGLLYWSCALGDTINVTRLSNGSALGGVVRGAPGEKPRNIALHPEKGLVLDPHCHVKYTISIHSFSYFSNIYPN